MFKRIVGLFIVVNLSFILVGYTFQSQPRFSSNSSSISIVLSLSKSTFIKEANTKEDEKVRIGKKKLTSSLNNFGYGIEYAIKRSSKNGGLYAGKKAIFLRGL